VSCLRYPHFKHTPGGEKLDGGVKALPGFQDKGKQGNTKLRLSISVGGGTIERNPSKVDGKEKGKGQSPTVRAVSPKSERRRLSLIG